MKIVYLGSGQFGIDCLNALEQSSQSLQFIVTQPPHPAGRGRKPSPTPVADWANAHSIPFVETDNVNAPEMMERIAGYKPDLIVVIAFGQKIGNDLINLPPKGAVNVHASLLPKYRGAAPINWVIINGETETGISIITLAEKMDAGQILAQSKTDIAPDETAGRLHDRLAQMAAPLLLKTIEQIDDGTAIYTEQDHSRATLAPKLKKTDGFIDFAEPAEVLERKIRGFWPWPGASATYLSQKTDKSTRVTIATAEVVGVVREPPNHAALTPGVLDENLNIICGVDALKIKKIKPAGSPLMDFKSFTNGRKTQPGDLFIKIDK
ncbi:MAG TPA: methionyl-tRNA formyltransferase [Sedimentisphaerales bacterium]|nr:methionyl-tRNA formyltransferase [Sedimentisphaerales bacterium]